MMTAPLMKLNLRIPHHFLQIELFQRDEAFIMFSTAWKFPCFIALSNLSHFFNFHLSLRML